MAGPTAPTKSYMGHERFMGFAPETNAPPIPGANAIPAGPTVGSHKLIGYASAPSTQKNAGTQHIRSVPAFRPVDTQQSTNFYTLSADMTLAATDDSELTFFDAISRGTSGTWPMTALGLPFFSAVTGAINDYDAARAYTDVWRYCLFNSWNFSFQVGQPVTVTAEVFAWLKETGTALSGAIGEDGSGNSLFGEAMMWNTVDFAIDTTPWRHALDGIDVGGGNNVSRNGIRSNLAATPAAARLTPETMLPGNEDVSLSLKFSRPIPAALLAGEIGPIVMSSKGSYAGVTKTAQITISNAKFASGGEDQVDTNSMVTHSAQLEAYGFYFEWV